MKDANAPLQVALRPPDIVMRLKRMGQSFPTRLSFLPTMLRRLAREGSRVQRPVWAMDVNGIGSAVYTLSLNGRKLSLVAISRDLADEDRSDRVIATAWDAAFVLYDGMPDASELERIQAAAPLQEAGRFSERDLVLSRANKSMRVWEHVTSALQAGTQPDAGLLREVGYLMRTTAVYGNGKFGIADRHSYADCPALSGPFAAEMLTVWLIRQFTLDLAEHVGGMAFEPDLKRGLGVGNATGLGMAPFLVSHPVLMHNWVVARETALARVRALERFTGAQKARAIELHKKAAAHLDDWRVPDVDAAQSLTLLRSDWQGLAQKLMDADMPEDVFRAAGDLSLAAQELVVSLLIELCPEFVDGLADCMADPFGPSPVLLGDTAAVGKAIAKDWRWALGSYDGSEAQRFWYISANKLEPRIGDRFEEHGSEWERPLDVARAVAELQSDLPATPIKTSDFLSMYPQHAFAVQRVSTLAQYPYAEIRDNLIGASCRPIDMLRFKLAFFGATRFDPKSDLWTRITLAQDAPLADEIHDTDNDWLTSGAMA